MVRGGRHPVRPSEGALLVNLGDAIARWTNDEWISTLHRVAAPRVNGVLVPRRSAAYFHDGDVDALIECLPGCVSAANPARYPPVTVGEHLAAKLAAPAAAGSTRTRPGRPPGCGAPDRSCRTMS